MILTSLKSDVKLPESMGRRLEKNYLQIFHLFFGLFQDHFFRFRQIRNFAKLEIMGRRLEKNYFPIY